jgi:hypothetical protein
MLTAIDLNDQTAFMTDEIENVAAKRNLAFEAETFEAMGPKRIP